MRFAHMADCHIGAWNDPKMKQASIKAFEKAIDICINEKVDFVLISGDLFNTSLPDIDSLKAAVKKLRQLRRLEISTYVIPGSHDFSPSGKTILGVLEEADLVINVAKGVDSEKQVLEFTTDKKTNANITGIPGKKGGLETQIYQNLEKTEQQGFKIFMFHTAISELLPKSFEKMDSAPITMLPEGFDYYAGGHVHIMVQKSLPGYKKITYPGPLFPDNFKELEDLQNGGFYIVDIDSEIKVVYEPINIYNVHSIKIECNNKTPEEVQSELIESFNDKEFINTIITIRLFGVLRIGKTTDIDFKSIMRMLQSKGAVFIMKNTYKLSSKEFEEVKISKDSVEEIEESLIKEHAGQIKVEKWDTEKQNQLIKKLMHVLDTEKGEDERVTEFEKRLTDNIYKVLE